MPNGHDGNAQPAIDIAEHHHLSETKRVTIWTDATTQVTNFGPPTNYALETGGNLAAINAKLDDGTQLSSIYDLNSGNIAGVNASGQLTTTAVVSSVTPGTASTTLGKAEDAAHASGHVGVMALGVRNSTATDLSAGATNGDYEPFQVDANGRVWVNGSGVTQPVSLASVPSHAVTNAGTFAVQESGSHLQTDDGTGFTVGTSKVNMGGYLADETSTDSVDENDVGAARMTLDRRQIVVDQPHTTGGWLTFMATSADGSTALTNSAQVIKGSAGNFGGYYIYNPNSSAIYVHIYNVAAASVTVGTTNPKNTFVIPATSAANLEISKGISYDTAMSCSATTTGGGSTAPTTALEANFWYK